MCTIIGPPVDNASLRFARVTVDLVAFFEPGDVSTQNANEDQATDETAYESCAQCRQNVGQGVGTL